MHMCLGTAGLGDQRRDPLNELVDFLTVFFVKRTNSAFHFCFIRNDVGAIARLK